MTAAEWTPSRRASPQAASTAGSPSLSTVVRISTICLSPSLLPASLRRTFSRLAGKPVQVGGPTIAEGIAVGFVVYVAFMAGCGRHREVSPLAYVLGVLFLAHLIWN